VRAGEWMGEVAKGRDVGRGVEEAGRDEKISGRGDGVTYAPSTSMPARLRFLLPEPPGFLTAPSMTLFKVLLAVGVLPAEESGPRFLGPPGFLAPGLATLKPWLVPFCLAVERILWRRSVMARGVGRSRLSAEAERVSEMVVWGLSFVV